MVIGEINIKDFILTRKVFYAIRDDAQWLKFIRKYELEKIFDETPNNYFDKGLELGCGSGENSKYLASYCNNLFALEYNKDRLTARSNEKTTFMIGDAQDLSRFKDNEMDMIFSSNLIEHLANLNSCLSECRRVAKNDALIIHTVPNRIWKLANFLLYYPFQIKKVFRRIFVSDVPVQTVSSKGLESKIDNNLREINRAGTLKKRLLQILIPEIHGISKSNIIEFKNWGEKYWLKAFAENGLEVINIVRMPFYTGWGLNFCFVLRLGNYLGLSSSTAYVLKKSLKQSK